MQSRQNLDNPRIYKLNLDSAFPSNLDWCTVHQLWRLFESVLVSKGAPPPVTRALMFSKAFPKFFGHPR